MNLCLLTLQEHLYHCTFSFTRRKPVPQAETFHQCFVKKIKTKYNTLKFSLLPLHCRKYIYWLRRRSNHLQLGLFPQDNKCPSPGLTPPIAHSPEAQQCWQPRGSWQPALKRIAGLSRTISHHQRRVWIRGEAPDCCSTSCRPPAPTQSSSSTGTRQSSPWCPPRLSLPPKGLVLDPGPLSPNLAGDDTECRCLWK